MQDGTKVRDERTEETRGQPGSAGIQGTMCANPFKGRLDRVLANHEADTRGAIVAKTRVGGSQLHKCTHLYRVNPRGKGWRGDVRHSRILRMNSQPLHDGIRRQVANNEIQGTF